MEQFDLLEHHHHENLHQDDYLELLKESDPGTEADPEQCEHRTVKNIDELHQGVLA